MLRPFTDLTDKKRNNNVAQSSSPPRSRVIGNEVRLSHNCTYGSTHGIVYFKGIHDLLRSSYIAVRKSSPLLFFSPTMAILYFMNKLYTKAYSYSNFKLIFRTHLKVSNRICDRLLINTGIN